MFKSDAVMFGTPQDGNPKLATVAVIYKLHPLNIESQPAKRVIFR
jgi:hypothetical protein